MKRELIGTAQGTVTLLVWCFMIICFFLVLKARLAGATAIDCTTTTECTTVERDTTTSGTIEHAEWIVDKWPGFDREIIDRMQDKIASKKFHCIEAGEYDSILAGITSGSDSGYYLDADGSTIWSSKRERITRCLPANIAFDHNKDLHHSLTIGHWLRWTESWQTVEHFVETICKTTIGGNSPVPEPSTLLLFGVGIAGIGLVGRKVL